MPDAALEGIKVLDLTHHIAGPYCTKLLADFGADVVKIERPGSGDPARRMGPFFQDDPDPDKSIPFLYLNTSKRSVTIDLKTDAGRNAVRRLARDADLVVENFSPTVLPSLGLGYETLRALNPRLVVVSISNFGQTGPYRDYKAADIVEYALGGQMYIFGSNDREPLKHAFHQAQFKAGTNAATAATIALYDQQLTDRGQWVDVSIQESIASALRDIVSLYTYSGAIKWRQAAHTGEMPRAPVRVKDGYIVPISFGGVDWESIGDFLEAPELKDARFSTPEGRSQHARELDRALESAFGRWRKLDLFHAAHRGRTHTYGLVQSPPEVVENAQYAARGYFVEIDHPVAGKATYPGAPLSMDGTPWRARSPAPTLGQHSQEVLGDELGYSSEELEQMGALGVR